MVKAKIWEVSRVPRWLCGWLVLGFLGFGSTRLGMSDGLKPGKDFTGVGVGAFIFDDTGRVLLLKRSSAARTAPGTWARPGGAVNYGESCEAALAREIREETSLEICEPKLLDVTSEPSGGSHWVSIGYTAQLAPGCRADDAKNMEPAKHDEIGFFDLEAEAPTSLGEQILERPSVAALRLLHSLAWLNKERPDFDMVLKMEDTCEVPLPRLLEQVVMQAEMHDVRYSLFGEIRENFALTVGETPQAWAESETDEVPIEVETFCLEMIQVSMSGMDMRGCLRVAAECCFQGSCTHDTLRTCTAIAREVGMETLMYFGTAFAPPFPEPSAWALGRGCVEFVVENLEDLKVRTEVPEILLGFWLAGLEDMNIVSIPEWSASKQSGKSDSSNR